MNFLLVPLLSACLALLQCLVGGTRLLYSYPCYALAAIAAISTLTFIRRPGPKPSTACLVSALLLAGYVFCRAWTSPQPYLARTDAFMVAGGLLVYLLTALYLHSSRARIWIVCVLLAVGAMHVVVGLIQFREQDGFMLFGFLRGDESCRASGMLISGNHLAGYLEAVALLALGLTAWSRYRFGGKLLAGYVAGFCYLGLILSGSRGGYLSAAASLLVFALFSLWIIGIYRRRDFTLSLIIILLGGSLLLGGTTYLMTTNTFINGRLIRLTQATKDVRVYNWLASLDQFKEAPMLGTGAGTHLYYGRLFRRPQIQNDPIHSHGDYLEMLAEYGVVGELLALGFLFTHLIYGIRNIGVITVRRLCNSLDYPGSDSLALCLGATTAVIALMAHSVVDFNMHIPGNALLFAFIFGIIANPGVGRAAPPPRRLISPEMLLRSGIVLAGIVLLCTVATRYKGEEWTEKARVALRNQDYKECIDRATLAIQADPTNPNAYFYQGEAYRVTASKMQIPALRPVLFENAIAAYRHGLALFPQDENLTVRLAQSLDGLHLFDEAEEAYLQALHLDPNLGAIHAYYSAHLHLTGQEEASKKYQASALNLGGDKIHDMGMEEAQSILDFDPGKTEEK